MQRARSKANRLVQATLCILAALEFPFLEGIFEATSIEVIASVLGIFKKTICTPFAFEGDLFETVI
ncbi:hypothetical protein AKJ13_15635 [Methylobacterium sp. ARG-1]|nr:hypothetical protein AKJ13_15635 [Methylobacterium sp. ARG-1]